MSPAAAGAVSAFSCRWLLWSVVSLTFLFALVQAGAVEAATPGTWNPTGSMVAAQRLFRSNSAVVLANGNVLIAGGEHLVDFQAVPDSPELYDTTIGVWRRTGAPGAEHVDGSLTLLESGRALLAGGTTAKPTGAPGTAEIYVASSDSWQSTGNLTIARSEHTATPLQNGKILVAGGLSQASNALSSSELYDPTTGTWTPTGSLHDARFGAAATLLADGRVLIVGGSNGPNVDVASAEVFDPASGTWTTTGSPSVGRMQSTSTRLPNGKVLLVGGTDSRGSQTTPRLAELYNPATGTWSPTGELNFPRISHSASLLGDGQVLVVGGQAPGRLGERFNQTEVYNPALGIWVPSGPLHTGRSEHIATLLGNGTVLVAGGAGSMDSSGNTPELASAELYTPITSSSVVLLSQPSRVVDTRTGLGGYTGAIAQGVDRCFSVAGQSGVPATATGVVVNITALGQSDTGWFTVYPAGQPLPATSTLNFDPHENAISNGAMVRLGTAGQVCIDAGHSAAYALVDITGYLSSSAPGAVTLLTQPIRVVDTRVGMGGSGPVTPAMAPCFTVAAPVGTPADAAGVLINLTAAGYTADGWLTMYPAGLARPGTSTLNFDRRVSAVANNAIIKVGTAGQICVSVGLGPSDVVIDMLGYVSAAGLNQVPLIAPARLVDTRSGLGGVVGPITTSTDRCFTLVGHGGIPANAVGVLLNVTSAGPAGNGWLTVYPAGQNLPSTSTLNFDANENAIANGTVVRPGTGGQVCIHSGQNASQVLLDATGYLLGP